MPRGSRRSAPSSPCISRLRFDELEAGPGVLAAGIDEAGRGPLAGPLVAACVILPPGLDIEGVDDSKVLSGRARVRLEAVIRDRAAAVGIGMVEPGEIDALGMTRSVLLSFERAVSSSGLAAAVYLVDGLPVRGASFPARFVVRGDSRSLCIGAASIVAKVFRDRLMAEADATWPGYGFAANMGYGTPGHLAALRRLGPCPIHRMSFGPLDRIADLFGGA